MRVVYFYPWGSFYPVRSGSARVVCNHLDYFRRCGWEVDCVVALEPEVRERALAVLSQEYGWLRSLHAVDTPRSSWTFRETILFYDESHAAQDLCGDLATGAELFFSNYVFTAPLLRKVPPGCRRILESHDLLTRMFRNIGASLGYVPRNCNDTVLHAKDARHLEIEKDLYRLYDAVIMISEQELQTMRSFGLENLHFVPQMFNAAGRPSPSARAPYDFDLLFVGSGNTFNVGGIDWFYRNVYVPFLWKHRVRLAVVGNVGACVDWDDPLVTKMVVDDAALDAVYQASKVVIAPIFEGTGTAVKTLEGLSKGGAIVATPTAARGISAMDEVLVCIDMRQDPQGTAGRILELLRSDVRRAQLQSAALVFMAKGFSRAAYDKAMAQVIDFALARRGADGQPHQATFVPAA